LDRLRKFSQIQANGRRRIILRADVADGQRMTPHRHILGTFEEALASLRNNVLMMAGLTERSLDRAMKGLFERNDDLGSNAIADDEETDQLTKQMDTDA